MATESLPTYGMAYSHADLLADASIFSSSTEAGLYEASKLLNPLRSKRWRTTTDNASDVVFDAGSAVGPPTYMALIDSNIGAVKANGITLAGATDSGFTSGVLEWTFDSYIPDDVARVVRFFMGAPDSGTAAARRYWKLSLNADVLLPALTYHELGRLWLGTYRLVLPEQGMRLQLQDPSGRSHARGGAVYVDRLPVGRTLDFDLRRLPRLEAYQIQQEIQAASGAPMIIDLHPAETDAEIRQQSPMYGLLDTRPLTHVIGSSVDSRLALSFVEARG